ncbi:MAG: hypothetical protein ACI9RU_000900 [Litorivivens sp.]|jgi:hypothetical protein
MKFSIDDYTIMQSGDQQHIGIDIHQKLHYATDYKGSVPLALTPMDLEGNREEFPVIANGHYSSLTIATNLETEKLFLELAEKVNQAVL